MNEQDKQLLLQDLCARLPYRVYVKDRNCTHVLTLGNTEFVDLFNGKCNIKPYLRHLSSMTEEEREEFSVIGGVMSYNIQNDSWAICVFTPEAFDWFNVHHFDYRGLIDKGLAIKVTEENNPYRH